MMLTIDSRLFTVIVYFAVVGVYCILRSVLFELILGRKVIDVPRESPKEGGA